MMGWLGKSEYNCPECDGDGECECSCCGAELECDHCNGTGWDPEQVDIDGFARAVDALEQKMKDADCVIFTHEWIDRESDERLGRSGNFVEHDWGEVAVKDFLLT